MIIEKEWVDLVAPEHSRTSCSDDNLTNAYGGWYGDYSSTTGEPIIRYPRCYRCYLLNNIGNDAEELEFKISLSVDLEWKGLK